MSRTARRATGPARAVVATSVLEVTRSLAIRTDSAMKMNKFMVMLGMMTALFTQNAASVQLLRMSLTDMSSTTAQYDALKAARRPRAMAVRLSTNATSDAHGDHTPTPSS